MKSLDKAWLGILLSACVAGMLWCGGCSMTPMQKARTTIAISADAVVAVDRLVAPRYAAVLGAASTDADTIRRWNAVVETLLLSRSAILVAEATLDAIEEGADEDYRGVMSCVVVAVQRLIEALPTVGVEVPQVLTMLMTTLGAFAGTCEPSDHVSVEGLMSADEVFAGSP